MLTPSINNIGWNFKIRKYLNEIKEVWNFSIIFSKLRFISYSKINLYWKTSMITYAKLKPKKSWKNFSNFNKPKIKFWNFLQNRYFNNLYKKIFEMLNEFNVEKSNSFILISNSLFLEILLGFLPERLLHILLLFLHSRHNFKFWLIYHHRQFVSNRFIQCR